MRTATVTEVKNGLSALLDRVRSGETVLVTDRGLPIARIEPVISYPDVEGRLRRLERTGVLRPGGGPAPLQVLRRPAPALPRGVSAVDIVLDERRAGR